MNDSVDSAKIIPLRQSLSIANSSLQYLNQILPVDALRRSSLSVTSQASRSHSFGSSKSLFQSLLTTAEHSTRADMLLFESSLASVLSVSGNISQFLKISEPGPTLSISSQAAEVPQSANSFIQQITEKRHQLDLFLTALDSGVSEMESIFSRFRCSQFNKLSSKDCTIIPRFLEDTVRRVEVQDLMTDIANLDGSTCYLAQYVTALN